MLKELLDYLNKEIYPNMTAKKVKEIKSKTLGGELLDKIKEYSDNQVMNALEKERETTTKTLEGYKKQLQELRENGKEKRVYKKRSDNYVGD